jgi:phospholipase C
MTLRTLDDLRADVLSGQLPQVSWILPSSAQSEHPRESTPDAGGFFTSQVLDAITANPAVWSETALLVMFDENDGFFDHIPPPAVPSFTAEGNLAGGSTVPLQGEYFDGAGRGTPLDASELTTTLRPWGMGARVPMYVISPWSRGGWVNSQVFDHTSIGLFLEKVFGVQIASISPWHRAVSGDLTSTFDFTSPNDAALPVLPDLSHYLATNAAQAKLPGPTAPTEAQALFQEPGVRSSRALPYALGATAAIVDGSLSLQFTNTGAQGAVFHVYDRRFPRRLPRRYTVEAGKSLTDTWTPTRRGVYDLEVHAPNGFQRSFSGNAIGWTNDAFRPEILVAFDVASNQLLLQVSNSGSIADAITLTPTHRAYGEDSRAIAVPAGGAVEVAVDLAPSAGWYGFTVSSQAFRRGFAGRLETGLHGISDPAMGFLFENRFHPSIRRWR